MSGGRLLWEPDDERTRRSNITAYAGWLAKEGRRFEDYAGMWRWSTDRLEEFWKSIWEYYGVESQTGYAKVLQSGKMPGAKWFTGAKVNYAAQVFRGKRTGPALISRTEAGEAGSVSWGELERMTGALANTLGELGVKKGDRVGAYLPNAVEAVVGLLACASVGAVWSSCPPDFGAPSVVDRFSQIAPKVLLAVDGYGYAGKHHDRAETVKSILSSLPTVKRVVMVRRGGSARLEKEVDWEDAVSGRARLRCEPVPSSHPLWILYSSGTTGMPKPIVHGHTGIILEHLKQLSLHNDIKPGDRFFWFTTTGWMMWNYLMGGLLHGATCVLYDGSPGYPDMDSLWDMVEDVRVTYMGLSAAYIAACMKASLEPGKARDLGRLEGIGSTGSPLSPESFEWVYGKVKDDLWLGSMSGGTDVCTAFVAGCPTLPVLSGEIQCRSLGAEVEAFDEAGAPVTDVMGELVVTKPMPSMPLYLWGDKTGERYRESYFEKYPGVWRHGDWVTVTDRGTCIIHGRSDATIKRLGVRIGTGEIYRCVEAMPEVADSLAIDLEKPGGAPFLLLFVVTSGGRRLDDALDARIREKVRTDLSPRHVPDALVQAPAIPRTLSGKKLEVPVKRIFGGGDVHRVLNAGSLANPDSLDFYVALAATYSRDGKL